MVSVGNFSFVPLITETLQHVAVLNITLLGPSEPGAVITLGGGLDNRLKTLFDALPAPSNQQELPRGGSREADENPFYCLLEDDKLITGLSIGRNSRGDAVTGKILDKIRAELSRKPKNMKGSRENSSNRQSKPINVFGKSLLKETSDF
jgi:hypothetical protein